MIVYLIIQYYLIPEISIIHNNSIIRLKVITLHLFVEHNSKMDSQRSTINKEVFLV